MHHTAHCRLHTAHHTPNTAHCTLTLHTIRWHCTPHTAHKTRNTAHCTTHTAHCRYYWSVTTMHCPPAVPIDSSKPSFLRSAASTASNHKLWPLMPLSFWPLHCCLSKLCDVANVCSKFKHYYIMYVTPKNCFGCITSEQLSASTLKFKIRVAALFLFSSKENKYL